MTDDLSKRLEACYTGAIHDVMRGMGFRHFVLPAEIVALDAGQRLAGPVFTVTGRPTPDRDAHETLYEWTGFLSKAPAGHVIVSQPNDGCFAHMGELSAETLKHRGVKGYVVDGGCRDVDFILRLGFPVWCRYTTPLDIVGNWLPTGFDECIRIGEVEIHAGDILLADRDGVVILPKERAAEIVAETERVINTESKVRADILAGEDPQQAYLKHGKF